MDNAHWLLMIFIRLLTFAVILAFSLSSLIEHQNVVVSPSPLIFFHWRFDLELSSVE